VCPATLTADFTAVVATAPAVPMRMQPEDKRLNRTKNNQRPKVLVFANEEVVLRVDRRRMSAYKSTMNPSAIPNLKVVCAVLEHPCEPHAFLLARRREDDPSIPGKWEFPGGKIEEGESETQALIREMREETGLEVYPYARLHAVFWDTGRRTIELIPYRCRCTTTKAHAHAHAQLQWLRLDAIQEADWAPADLPIVSEVMAGKGSSASRRS
jgi:8-oxo-dGTP diphosphatase